MANGKEVSNNNRANGRFADYGAPVNYSMENIGGGGSFVRGQDDPRELPPIGAPLPQRPPRQFDPLSEYEYIRSIMADAYGANRQNVPPMVGLPQNMGLPPNILQIQQFIRDSALRNRMAPNVQDYVNRALIEGDMNQWMFNPQRTLQAIMEDPYRGGEGRYRPGQADPYGQPTIQAPLPDQPIPGVNAPVTGSVEEMMSDPYGPLIPGVNAPVRGSVDEMMSSPYRQDPGVPDRDVQYPPDVGVPEVPVSIGDQAPTGDQVPTGDREYELLDTSPAAREQRTKEDIATQKAILEQQINIDFATNFGNAAKKAMTTGELDLDFLQDYTKTLSGAPDAGVIGEMITNLGQALGAYDAREQISKQEERAKTDVASRELEAQAKEIMALEGAEAGKAARELNKQYYDEAKRTFDEELGFKREELRTATGTRQAQLQADVDMIERRAEIEERRQSMEFVFTSAINAARTQDERTALQFSLDEQEKLMVVQRTHELDMRKEDIDARTLDRDEDRQVRKDDIEARLAQIKASEGIAEAQRETDKITVEAETQRLSNQQQFLLDMENARVTEQYKVRLQETKMQTMRDQQQHLERDMRNRLEGRALDTAEESRKDRVQLAEMEDQLSRDMANAGIAEAEVQRILDADLARERMVLDAAIAGLESRTALRLAAVQDPYAAAVQRMAEGGVSPFMAGLEGMGFEAPTAESAIMPVPADNPLAQFVARAFPGGMPTIGALAETDPESLNFLNAILAATGITPEQFGLGAGAVTPGVNVGIPTRLETPSYRYLGTRG